MTQALREKRSTERTTEPDEIDTEAAVARRAEAEEQMDSTDALLDEIDAVLEVPVPAPEKYTLADAIREGSLLHPQAVGSFKGPQGETCALSAALDAVKARGIVK